MLLHMESLTEWKLLGETLDDAAIVKNLKRKFFQYNQILANYSLKTERDQLLLPLFVEDAPHIVSISLRIVIGVAGIG
ncbi:MAG: hypothetical protein Q8R26_01200 [bacterium]|nr:hypothetical protein [bacterium]